jgi:creatinine amidohydrolase
MIRDLSIDYPDFLIACSEWYTFVPKKGIFDEPGDHADEVETSVMMHYHPELVNIEEAGSGASREFASKMLREKVAWVPRHWMQVSSDTGIGDPRKATAEKGARYVETVVERYAQLVNELAEGVLYV